MDLGLHGRTAAVTGGSKGIGRAIARGLAAEGVNLLLIARGKEQLDKTAGEIRTASKVKVEIATADIRDTAAVKAAADAGASALGTINILVNNAGGPIRRMDRQINWPDTDWIDDVNSKTFGMLRVIQAFLPHLAKDGTGRIINISGVAGTAVWVPALTHGINNAAMIHATGYLAQDLAGDRITVNTVVPGIVGTEAREGWAENMAKQQGRTKDEFLADFCKRLGILAGRWASMDDVADMVAFVASDRARYVNGARLHVDGGMNVNPRPA